MWSRCRRRRQKPESALHQQTCRVLSLTRCRRHPPAQRPRIVTAPSPRRAARDIRSPPRCIISIISSYLCASSLPLWSSGLRITIPHSLAFLTRFSVLHLSSFVFCLLVAAPPRRDLRRGGFVIFVVKQRPCGDWPRRAPRAAASATPAAPHPPSTKSNFAARAFDSTCSTDLHPGITAVTTGCRPPERKHHASAHSAMFAPAGNSSR